MVQKKSPCEKIQNQINKTELKLTDLKRKYEEEATKGHNVLPHPDLYLLKNETGKIVFDNVIDKQIDEFLKIDENKENNENKKVVKKRVKKDIVKKDIVVNETKKRKSKKDN